MSLKFPEGVEPSEPKPSTFKAALDLMMILPASGQEHGLLNEDRAGQQDVPAASNVVRAERHREKMIMISTERA